MSDETKCTIGRHEIDATMKAISEIVEEEYDDDVLGCSLSPEAETMIRAEVERILAVAGVEVKS